MINNAEVKQLKKSLHAMRSYLSPINTYLKLNRDPEPGLKDIKKAAKDSLLKLMTEIEDVDQFVAKNKGGL